MDDLNGITGRVINAAIRVHRGLGPGLMESVYEAVLFKTLARDGLQVERQKPVTFEFEGIVFEDGFKADLVVERSVVLELKSVEKLAPIHTKQLLTYLRLLDLHLGLVINFGAPYLRDGIKRVVNGPPPED
jgi:GxxExxY protein